MTALLGGEIGSFFAMTVVLFGGQVKVRNEDEPSLAVSLIAVLIRRTAFLSESKSFRVNPCG